VHPCAECKGKADNCTICVDQYAFSTTPGLCVPCSDLDGYDYPWFPSKKVPGGGVCTEICGDGKR
jgi:hypothetical protein